MTTVAYHAPYPLNPKATSASGIRPVKMKQAFESLGYEVIDLTGNAKTRASALQRLKADLDRGRKIDLCYSESATIPNMVTEPKHFPLHPFLDRRLLKTLHQAGVPIGLFYRDIYWKYDDYRQRVGWPLATINTRMYHWDLATYRAFVDRLFVPSLKMAAEVPGYPLEQAVALPPGAQIRDTDTEIDGVRILYIGALGGHYRTDLLFEAVAQTPGVELTVCTGAAGWESAKPELERFLSDRIRVVHKSGEELNELYDWATVCSIYMRPDEYRSFAQPMKVYEYLGAGKPIIASARTMAGDFITEGDCGWTIPYDLTAAKELLGRLAADPSEIVTRSEQAKVVRQNHTWEARAQFVIDTLPVINK
ncbi:hypothetical protein BK816_08455 [Boudabousia tangfeifanii]|uniref:Glycosyl transferase family 1 domain-containing protein n=1 Tax=Boudabousia tangfeifanii TaxID=1912795 RepID=A0A1D9MMA9_9ACTO|nr:glycosyltransferase [Boudabousia tangfeifanii]AOZ73303.1 hypothetical protein BK816_08455 [Boudabousia tangfeifanii]